MTETSSNSLLEIGDRVRGILFGLAAGDRIGGPIAMALCLSESLIQQSAFDSADILRRYLEWWHAEGFDTGPVAARVFALISGGLPVIAAVEQVHYALDEQTAGCNPAHRIAPIAMAGFLQDHVLSDIAHQEARLTHWDILAGDVAASVAILCRGLVRGIEWIQAVEQILPKTVLETLQKNPGQLMSRGGYAPNVFHTALHFVSKYSSFEEALNESIRYAGPANYCPVLAGVFAGARWGRESINEASLAHCSRFRSRLEYTANTLVQTWK